jgi:sec-independent protein translocase protein TatB
MASMADTIFIMVLALVVFGPRRLPQIGRQIGKLMYEFRKASNDFKFQMEEELRQSEEADRRKKEEEERQKALAAAPPAPQLGQPAASVAAPAALPESVAPATQETPAESLHPEETAYSDRGAEYTRSEESAGASTAVALEAERLHPESSIAPNIEPGSAPNIEPRIQPRIQPVSTGEVVAANPPGRPAQQAELFESNAESAAEPGAPQQEDATTASESTTPDAANCTHRSEPAAHHG